MAPYKIQKLSFRAIENLQIRLDEELALVMSSAFKTVYGGQVILSLNSLTVNFGQIFVIDAQPTSTKVSLDRYFI